MNLPALSEPWRDSSVPLVMSTRPPSRKKLRRRERYRRYVYVRPLENLLDQSRGRQQPEVVDLTSEEDKDE
ncbi:hypothetical protein V7S43_013136 [Phytophthora oleae]|uniref:Uncharacterized protein n=1 Tax=Phytophthora oleae TaxID=2107226 RepID=A0ABD3F5U5_9STRA